MMIDTKYLNKKTITILVICFIIVAGVVAGYVILRTKNRVQVEFNIHINQQSIYLSTYSEPPQFAIWIENPRNGKCQQVFVTYRASRGDWEGKADVPALPRWKTIVSPSTRVKQWLKPLKTAKPLFSADSRTGVAIMLLRQRITLLRGNSAQSLLSKCIACFPAHANGS